MNLKQAISWANKRPRTETLQWSVVKHNKEYYVVPLKFCIKHNMESVYNTTNKTKEWEINLYKMFSYQK